MAKSFYEADFSPEPYDATVKSAAFQKGPVTAVYCLILTAKTYLSIRRGGTSPSVMSKYVGIWIDSSLMD